jgi:hypothetical protein
MVLVMRIRLLERVPHGNQQVLAEGCRATTGASRSGTRLHNTAQPPMVRMPAVSH